MLINLFPPLREKMLPLFQKNVPLSSFFSPLPHKKRSADLNFWGSPTSFSAANFNLQTC
jgi:hypothetical protein